MKDKYVLIRNTLFNQDQLALIEQMRLAYEDDDIDEDCFEWDLWYTMNQSGLFDKDYPRNKSEIYDWTPTDTRIFITSQL